ncbi:hypothetical protein OG462_24710 [Streptomyces sp. NBC_01077]|uniref:hypothetical protein n=1 Tax=Streptomyces sp. NBC_01077 TaxID=2903746 RepID=UPI0038660CE5|nr:hypothetical protein OG462_24710 [Streptomyces sp. NBC_01077]
MRTPPRRRGRLAALALTLATASLLALTPTGGATAALPGTGAGPKPVPSPGAQAGRPFPAIADPVPGGFGSWQELFTVQQRLNAAASSIKQAADAAGHTGLTGIIAAPENRELRVYWHGAVPADMRKHIENRAAAVPVSVLPAEYSKAELGAEARRLLASGSVSLASTRADGKGVDVRRAPGATVEKPAVGGVPAFTDPAASTAGSAPVPLSCADGAAYCREDDISPYYAGARTSGCTTGWPVRLRTGARAILTAAHCGGSGTTAYDGGGDVMGTVENHDPFFDLESINTNANGRMWDGWWQNSTFTKPVHGLGNSWVGNWICMSGSRSGTLCGLQVTQVNASNLASASSWPNWPYSVAAAHDASFGPGNGDSGGPTFDLTGDLERVIAKGSVSHGYGDAEVPCKGQPSSSTRKCYWLFAYTEVYTAFNDPISPLFGSEVITG